MRLGAIGADCGENPCGAKDWLLPFAMSRDCSAYLACQVTGGYVTPSPEGVPNPMDIATGGGGEPSGEVGFDVRSLQARCAEVDGEWDGLNGVCRDKKKTLMDYIPWMVGGLALVLILPAVMPRR